MADDKLPQFSEDDDLARARAFWKSNGKSIIFGIGLGLAGIAGFNFWQSYEKSQGESASTLYDRVLSSENTDIAIGVGDDLKSQFGDSVYAVLGAFSAAKSLVEEKNYDGASSQLQWVLQNSDDQGILHIARLRLAAVYIANDQAQLALDTLELEDAGGFSARYQELRGDAYVKRNQDGDLALAKTEYENSLESADETVNPALIKLKLDNLTLDSLSLDSTGTDSTDSAEEG